MKRLGLIAFGALCVCAALCRAADPEMDKPLLRHIVAPREAIDLCGEWDYHHGLKTDKFTDAGLKWTKTTVPGRLWFNIWDKPPQRSDAMYRRTFTLTKDQAAKHAELFFEQACYDTYVYVNGHEAYRSYDWCTPFRVDVTRFVKEGENTLEVRCFIAPDSDYSHDGKDAPNVAGWYWGGWTGIVRPVHLELSDPVHVVWARVEPRVVGGKVLAVSVCVTNASAHSAEAFVKAKVEGEQWSVDSPVELGAGKAKEVVLKKAWPEARLWNPDDPFLYNLDVSLHSTPTPKTYTCVDALRQRFGFREFRIEGKHVTLNGHPFVNRRDSVSLGTESNNAVCIEGPRMRTFLQCYKSHGFVGMRSSPAGLYRELEVCDEMGFLVSPLLPTGSGYGRNPPYWSAVSNMVRRAAEAYRNHPSLMYWCLFNEFGKNYGVPNWKEQYPKMVAMGDYLKTFDPTTFWTSCGDTELDPVNGNGPGPAPVRSLHYPVCTAWGGNDFPEIGWWYGEGRDACWQGLGTPDKPTFISEDLYHGMNDSVPSMTRWGSDSIYETDGYVEAWRDAILMFADGHYYGGLGEWNPWFTCSGSASNLLFKAGELMPTYLVSLRHAFPNLAAGSSFEDDLYVHNQSFTERKLKLNLRYSWTGKTETREMTLPPGGRYDGKLKFDVPAADGARIQPIAVEAKLWLGASNVFARVFRYNAVPFAKRMPKGAVLLTNGETPLKTMFENVYTNAEAALAAKPSVIVLAGSVTGEEGRKVAAWVRKGGKAVRFASTKNGWSPVPVRDRMTHAYAWRRNADFLKDIPESFFSVWRPTATVGKDALSFMDDADQQVLLDEGEAKGITAADAARLLQEKGSWLVTSLPVEECLDDEPAARYLAVRLVVDQLKWQAQPDGGFAFLTKNHPLAEFFKANLFLPETKASQAKVVIADASAGEKLVSLAKAGKTVFVTGVTTNAGSRALLAKLGVAYEPVKPWVHPPNEPAAWKAPVIDTRRDWFTHRTNAGLLAGISNTDLFFSTIDLGGYYRWRLTGNNATRADTLPAVTGHFAGEGLVYPNAMVDVPVGKGRVVVSSFDWALLAGTHPSKVLKIWRNLLVNAGARTAPVRELHTIIPLPFRNGKLAHLWAAPGLDANVPAFFGNGDDMRYFPVNLCGWSVEANNKCPVQDFPKGKVYFDGIPFILAEPNLKNGGAVAINSRLIGAPGKDGTRLDRLWVLAAIEDDEGLKSGDPVVELLIQNGKDAWHTAPRLGAVAKYGEDLGAYRHPIPLTRGKIAWRGHSGKTKDAALYVFSIENVFDKSIPVQHMLLRAAEKGGKPVKNLAILGVSWQVD